MIKTQRSTATAVAMCRRETNLFFFTLGDGSLPLGRNCATCVFEKSRNRVVLDGGDF